MKELIMCEFGSRKPHGGIDFSSVSRLEPTLSSFRKCFGIDKLTVYTDDASMFSGLNVDDVKEVQTPHFIDRKDPRWGYKMSDYYRVYGLLASDAEFAIYSDSDMYAVSPAALQAITMCRNFGFCIPANPRSVLKVDASLGADAPSHNDHIGIVKQYSHMFSFNAAPLFFNTNHELARRFLLAAKDIFEKAPMRGPSLFNLASIETGYFPCLLPFQWCVSRDNVDHEMILHVGKQQVFEKYFKR